MKRFFALLGVLIILLSGCSASTSTADIAATTLPIYQFSTILCEGTGLTVTRLVTESVSCLHDYTLNVAQVKAVESADLVIISGAGLEDFMADLLIGREIVDASTGIALLESCHDHDHEAEHGHNHDSDAHIWLSPANALIMAENICHGLMAKYPQHSDIFLTNLQILQQQLLLLQSYGQEQLADLPYRDMITFHDGFAYMAQAFNLHILAAVEEESGAETSAKELIELITMAQKHNIPAIFTESNGSTSAAQIISAEIGIPIYTLDMAMAGDDYFKAMYHNIDCIREALS
jgi:ABC-type Zn uptake system ZnuABC Zn-binding protein ZnuA